MFKVGDRVKLKQHVIYNRLQLDQSGLPDIYKHLLADGAAEVVSIENNGTQLVLKAENLREAWVHCSEVYVWIHCLESYVRESDPAVHSTFKVGDKVVLTQSAVDTYKHLIAKDPYDSWSDRLCEMVYYGVTETVAKVRNDRVYLDNDKFFVMESDLMLNEFNKEECTPVSTVTTTTTTEWTDAHYDAYYTLTPKDIENGKVKIDPYRVSKQWRLGAKDESGALFHILKTLARFGEKNSREREIKALYAQIKCLAEMEGVEL